MEDAVGIRWVDYKGVCKATTRLDPGDRWSTHNTHAWSIVNPETEEEILRIRFVEPGPLTFSEIFAAQGSSTKASAAQGKAHNSVGDDWIDEIPDEEETVQEGQDDSVMEGQGWGGLGIVLQWRKLERCHAQSSIEPGRFIPKAALQHLELEFGREVVSNEYSKLSKLIAVTKQSTVQSPDSMSTSTLADKEGVEENNPNLRPRLTLDLKEFNRVYPPGPLQKLQEKSGFWINESRQFEDEKRPRSGMVTHFSSAWLKKKGDNPAKTYCVENYKASTYAIENGIFKAVIVHELSHAYHSICYRDGVTNNKIREAYLQGVAAGYYDNGEYNGNPIREGTHWTGKLNRRPYAAKNHYEYWAEANASFFSSNRFRNGFYPYVHAELKHFDPFAYQMVEEVLGIKGDEMTWSPVAKFRVTGWTSSQRSITEKHVRPLRSPMLMIRVLWTQRSSATVWNLWALRA
eukprot:symbB.v1.2.026253.t2/scaffold2581.1/size75808/2